MVCFDAPGITLLDIVSRHGDAWLDEVLPIRVHYDEGVTRHWVAHDPHVVLARLADYERERARVPRKLFNEGVQVRRRRGHDLVHRGLSMLGQSAGEDRLQMRAEASLLRGVVCENLCSPGDCCGSGVVTANKVAKELQKQLVSHGGGIDGLRQRHLPRPERIC